MFVRKTPIIIFGSHFFLNSITWITQKILGVYLCMVFEICFFVLKNKGNKENIKTTFGPSFFFFFLFFVLKNMENTKYT